MDSSWRPLIHPALYCCSSSCSRPSSAPRIAPPADIPARSCFRLPRPMLRAARRLHRCLLLSAARHGFGLATLHPRYRLPGATTEGTSPSATRVVTTPPDIDAARKNVKTLSFPVMHSFPRSKSVLGCAGEIVDPMASSPAQREGLVKKSPAIPNPPPTPTVFF